MKTFEQEYQALLDWVKKTRAEADEEIKNLPKIEGYDDRAAPILYKVNQERNRRLRALKKKYGKEITTANESEPITESVKKGRTFRQVVQPPV